MADASVFAIGRLEAGGAWVGLARAEEAYRLIFGTDASAEVSVPASRAELLAVAIGYFEESVDDAPPELEATHHDIAQLLRWLRGTAEPAHGRLLLDVVEGIDDGVAGDVMVQRLSRAYDACRTANEQAAPLDLLVERYRALSS